MISQLFILSLRGDIIINRDFRSELIKITPEIFYRNVKLYKGDAPPLFNIEGINFAYIKKAGLYIVCTSRFDVCPSIQLEILNRVCKIIKDYCGIMNEEAIRKNFVLIYEILDEVIDFGYPQLTSSDQIKPHIVNEPITLQVDSSLNMPKPIFGKLFFNPTTINSKAANKSIKENKRNEIFVDVLEKISVLFNTSGYVINQSIDGCIQMKSFLNGNPPLKLQLCEDLQIGKNNGNSLVVLDDCNFHDCVNTQEFESSKLLKIHPPDGEFTAMGYRVTNEFQVPYKVSSVIEETSNYKLELNLKIKSCYPKEVTSTRFKVRFPLPKLVSNVYNQLAKGVLNQKVDTEINQNNNSKFIEWTINKFQGNTEQTLNAKITLQQNTNIAQARKEIGPININFEIPMYNLSNLQIKYLKIEEKEKKQNPYRWVRYVTSSDSYICRT